MDTDYMSRGYLLPKGCKDLIDVIAPKGCRRLIDVIAPKVTATDQGLMITVELPDARSAEIEITCEGRQIRISLKQSSDRAAFESVTDVPHDYDLSQARASYSGGQLRIVVPRS
jgi:HSP20 family molecular chaperone IbpA